MLRAGVDFDLKNSLAVDVQTIFHKMEKANIRSCLSVLLPTKESRERTQLLLQILLATYEVLLAQLRSKYDSNLENRSEMAF